MAYYDDDRNRYMHATCVYNIQKVISVVGVYMKKFVDDEKDGKLHESTSTQIWIKLGIVLGHELRFNNSKNKKSLHM